MEIRYASRISANCRMTGTACALARVFGPLTTVFQTDRLTVRESPCIVRPFQSTQFAFRSPAKDAVATTAFGTRQKFQNATNLSQIVRKGFAWFACVPRDSGILNRVRTVERAFILRMSENAAQHTLDMLKRRFAQIVFFGNCLEHPAGIHRSELTQPNMPDTIARCDCSRFPDNPFFVDSRNSSI